MLAVIDRDLIKVGNCSRSVNAAPGPEKRNRADNSIDRKFASVRTRRLVLKRKTERTARIEDKEVSYA
jgi:hypothetical protein